MVSSPMPRKYKFIGFIILLFHLVGAMGTILPATKDLVLPLTPFNLVLSTAILIYSHTEKYPPLIIFFLASFAIGFSIEVVGVHTGYPFGDYAYGSTLGPKLLGVPLTIGLNWFLLTYLFGMAASLFLTSKVFRILVASSGMVLLDVLIEPVAIELDYWNWAGPVPIENYLSWFVISGILQVIFVNSDFYKINPVTVPLLIAQAVYFGIIHLKLYF